MSQKEDYSAVFRAICDIGQLGLSVVVPIVLCAFGGRWLQNRFSLPDYVTVIAILIGVAAAINGFVRFVKDYLSRIDKDNKKR